MVRAWCSTFQKRFLFLKLQGISWDHYFAPKPWPIRHDEHEKDIWTSHQSTMAWSRILNLIVPENRDYPLNRPRQRPASRKEEPATISNFSVRLRQIWTLLWYSRRAKSNRSITQQVMSHFIFTAGGCTWRLSGSTCYLSTLCPTIILLTRIFVSVVLSLFLVNLEVSIVSTSLVAISNELHGFSKTSWIITGYLITYMGDGKSFAGLSCC